MARHEPRRNGTPAIDPQALRDVIAANIKAAQSELGLRTEDLAREVGLGLRLVQKHRAGHNAPSFENLARYAQVLRRPIAWFFERHPEVEAA